MEQQKQNSNQDQKRQNPNQDQKKPGDSPTKDSNKQSEIGSKGKRIDQDKGTAHEFNYEEAKEDRDLGRQRQNYYDNPPDQSEQQEEDRQQKDRLNRDYDRVNYSAVPKNSTRDDQERPI